MKLRRPLVQRQVVARVIEGEPWEFVIADWPEGTTLPEQVVQMIMGTWTPDGSWIDRDGSILWVQEHRQRGRAFKVERYPLIVVDQHRDDYSEVLYDVEALEAAKRNGIVHVKAHVITEADGFPPRGQRKAVSGTELT
jgi:hypothetical protein